MEMDTRNITLDIDIVVGGENKLIFGERRGGYKFWVVAGLA
jgi:hypothetical protein